jgi:hypothetical protein
VGIQLSLLDLLAPFSEAAARKGTYTNASQPYLLLDLLRPRVGLWLGVPEFSRHLLITGSVGARFITVKPNGEENEYVLPFASGAFSDAGDVIFNMIELSGSVAYVF